MPPRIKSLITEVRSRGFRTVAMGVCALVAAGALAAAVDVAAPEPAAAAQDPTTCGDAAALVNGGFEEPVVAGNRYGLLPQGDVPGWSTTDTRGAIEIWKSGFNGVPAAEGDQFAEMNAYSAGTLYQDIETTPGQSLSWSLSHRGRDGVDVMRVLIGTPDDLVQSGPDLSDARSWGEHSGTYVVPDGQTTTRFAFQAVSSSSSSNAAGNLLDNIMFGTGPCVISDKTVENVTTGAAGAEVGDVLRYTVTTRNDGGNASREMTSTDVLDPGLDFVPGSLQIVSGSGTGTLTDASGDDRGEYIDADRTVRVRLGEAATESAGGAMLPGTTTTYSFEARVNVDAADSTLLNEAQVAFFDPVLGEDRVSVTQTTETPVGEAADLAITKTLETSPLVAGEPVTYDLTVTNNGPQAAEDFTVYDPVPGVLSDVQAETASGSCVVTSSVNCIGGALAPGDSAEITITGVLSPDAQAGSAVVNTAQVESATMDQDQSNNTSTASSTVTAVADVAVEKTFSPEQPTAGEDVVYTIAATNAGPSTATDVVITDPLDPATTFVSAESDAGACDFDGTAVSCPVGSLEPGGSADVVVTATLAADADAAVQNTATVATSASDSDATNNASSTSFDPTIDADLAVTKSASVETATAGDTFTYTIDVTNNGPSAAQNAVLTDAVPDGLVVQGVAQPDGAVCSFDEASARCDWAELPPGQTATVEVAVLVPEDAPAGSLVNTASVAAPSDDADTTNNSDSSTVVVDQSADIGVEKTAMPNPGIPGTEQSFTITVTNHGPSTARGVTVADVIPSELQDASADEACTLTGVIGACALGDLAAGDSASVTVTGTIAPDATGSISNTARATSGTPDPNGDNYQSTVTVPLEPSADVSLTKTTSTPEVVLDGEVRYEVAVRNDGPSTATGVIVEDTVDEGIALTGAEASVGTLSGNIWNVGALQPGEAATIAITGVAHAEGTFTNTATASSESPDPDADDLTAAADVTVAAAADLAITKTISDDPAPSNGEVTYTIAVENFGPNDASEVVVTDELPAELLDATTIGEGCEIADGVLTCEAASLADGDTLELVVTGTIDPATGSDEISNTASVTATQADPDADNNSSTVVAPITGESAVELTKAASQPADTNGDGRVGAGDEIEYSFVVENTGSTRLAQLALDDPLLGGAVECTAFDGARLAPGESLECGPVAYALTQADIDAGTVANTATITATSPRGDASDEATATTIVPTVDAVSLAKSGGTPADVDGDGRLGAGDTVDYAFTVTNTGTTTLTGAAITDPMLGGAVACPELEDADLAPGDAIECAPVTYELTQVDIDEGSVHNEAQVTADAPSGGVSDDASAEVDVDGTDALELQKSATGVTDVDGDGRYGVGDEIGYTFTVVNTGTTAETIVAIDDPLLGGDTGCLTDGAVTLAPGETFECGPVAYALTQEDVDAGVVENTATATGEGRASVEDSGTAAVRFGASAGVDLTKTAAAPADADGDGMIGAGDTVDYTFTVENTGTATLTSATLEDPLLGGDVACDALDAEIAPGEAVECGPVAYPLTQEDVDAGAVHNEASVVAQSSAGEASDSDAADVAVTGTDAIALAKTAGEPVDADGDGMIGAGDTIDYAFTVTNTGTTTLADAAIDDPMLGGAIDCAELAGTALAPGDAVDCAPVAYALTQEDVDAGVVRNAATVTATGSGGEVSDDADATATLATASGISLAKTAGEPVDANGDGALGAGDTIEYTFSVANTGTTTLSGVAVTDPMLDGAIDCAAGDGGSIAPGETVECAPVEYVLTTDDVDAGAVNNTATATAESPHGDVDDTASAETTIAGTSAVELVKTVEAVSDTTGDGRVGAGDEVTYAFTATNIGTRTVTDPAIEDPLLGGPLECPALTGTELAPGDAIGCGPYAYEITQSDVEAGVVHNTATLTTASASDDASIAVMIAGADGIALDKTASAPVDVDGDGMIGAGDELSYSFAISNTGTTVLTDIAIDDPLLGGAVGCPAVEAADLAPGESVDCGPVPYTLTQGDIDVRTLHNEATVTATGAAPVTDTASADVDVDGTDAIALVKSAAAIEDANGSGAPDAGDTIDYSFAVTNAGTTTLTQLEVADARIDGGVACESTAILPGEMVACGAEPVVLTDDDVAAGQAVNTATATAVGARGTEVRADDTVTTPIEAQPAVALEKTGGGYDDANGDREVSAGDTVQFRFTVTNTGATALTDIAIDDPKLGGAVACDIPDLAPGESAECGPVAYSITADEAASRTVVNAATAAATGGAVVVTASDSATVDLPELAVTGGLIVGLGWALLFLALGAVILLLARRSRRTAI
ncbi:DUF7507 domain-containing protein [Microbacterium halophytorum]|uniref:DUF7507 domain-containing protein n=1 Tax=Microbacterium halophytorum TaxID=2067568 RepID=UPI001319C2F8|nr:DUF11 domain-containing protein [Microbacterium halophytorum]